ncbi:hypothetical protein Rhopal_000630-T1 [Rhodotorula paludigena]|uniref:Uncharacterized protein n=1 Tax=Rhodotorula paludigena TaxID=86838 RepID=A0AAV5GDF3_9BASI|nr:hypothetical protein Rhopal_000630-T1 [Rhodotorula paludigena]
MHPPSPLCAPGKRIRGAATVPCSETHTFAFVPSCGTAVHVYHLLQWAVGASVDWNARRLDLSTADEELLVALISTRAVRFLRLRQSSERASNSAKENIPPMPLSAGKTAILANLTSVVGIDVDLDAGKSEACNKDSNIVMEEQ